MRNRSETGIKGLYIILTVVFILAMVLGRGPGVYLINPGPEHEGPAPTLIGLPIVYAWAVLWFGVQAVVLVTAYFTVWADQEEEE